MNDNGNLKDLLEEENSQTNPQVDPAKLQALAQNQTMSSKADNPYVDQQIQPGQVIGYNIPTNQEVVIPIEKAPKFRGPSKKFLRSLIVSSILIASLAVLLGLGYLAYKVISS